MLVKNKFDNCLINHEKKLFKKDHFLAKFKLLKISFKPIILLAKDLNFNY